MTTLEPIIFKRKENSELEIGTVIFSDSIESVKLVIDDKGKEVNNYCYIEKNDNMNIVPLF